MKFVKKTTWKEVFAGWKEREMDNHGQVHRGTAKNAKVKLFFVLLRTTICFAELIYILNINTTKFLNNQYFFFAKHIQRDMA